MIEAVNSVISNAQVSRGAAENLAATRSVEVNATPAPEPVQAPVAPFISPYISVDLGSNKAVIQIRDSDTGDVVDQFPSEQTLQSRQRAEQLSSGIDSASQGQNPRPVAANSQAATTFVASEVSVETSTPRGAGAAAIASAALNSGAQVSNTVSASVISTSA